MRAIGHTTQNNCLRLLRIYLIACWLLFISAQRNNLTMNASVRTLPTSRFEAGIATDTVDEWPGVWPGYLCVVIGRGKEFWGHVLVNKGRVTVPMTRSCVEIHTYRTLGQNTDHIILENGKLQVINFTVGEQRQWIVRTRPFSLPLFTRGDVVCDEACRNPLVFTPCRHRVMVSYHCFPVDR